MKKLMFLFFIIPFLAFAGDPPKDVIREKVTMPNGEVVMTRIIDMDIDQSGFGTYFDASYMTEPANVFVFREDGRESLSVINIDTKESISTMAMGGPAFQLFCFCRPDSGGCGNWFCPNPYTSWGCNIHCSVCGTECANPKEYGCGDGKCFCSIRMIE